MAMDQLYTDTLKELGQARAARDEYRNHLEVICEMTGEGSDIGAAHEAVNALIEQRDQHKAAEEAQIALRAKMERQRDSLQRLANNRAEQRDSLLVYVGKLQDVIRRMDWESRMLDPEQTAVFEEARQLIAQPVTNDLERRDTLKQAEGAAMVAKSAWSRKNLDAFGSTPQECAASLATLIGNDLRWKADYKPEDCDLECGAYGTFCKCKADALSAPLDSRADPEEVSRAWRGEG
ncbi:hypothetical protein [Vreelandella glaciei]|uniref:hypothetical protein n=1 Tax=Vreelandella glaciei TaxID=186761 RepID=UPI0030EC6957|tara:strand:+ start:29673 stop:30377 length:705 start_codon:yes stop_codon:yes gene_type:complete